MLNFNKLEQLIKEKGWSKVYFSSLFEKNKGWITDMKRGIGLPDENLLRSIADKLGTTVDYLTDKTDIKEQKNKPTTDRSELKPLARESLDIIDSLPEDLQNIALAQLRALAAAAENNKKN